MKPKTVKSFLKMCVAICETNRDDLKGIDKLTEQEYFVLGSIRAGVQNDLGDNAELMEKYKLKVKI
jgi:hypothetical protein